MAVAAEEIKVRLTAADKHALQQAAELEGLSLSQFIRHVAGERARAVIEEARLRQLTFLPPASFDQLVAALDEPGVPIGSLVEAANELVQIELD